jgi:membrane-associated phospholipid phosphatase
MQTSWRSAQPVSRATARLVVGICILLLAGWATGELWLSAAGSTDIDAVREVAAQRTAALADAAKILTWAGSALVLGPLALICCAALARAGYRREALAVALSLGGAMLLSYSIKQLVARPRPPVEHLQAVSSSSFPSGHAAQASAFWLSLILALRATNTSRRAIDAAFALALALIVAVAASRVWLGVHYPSDVVAGALLGACWALFVARCLRDPDLSRWPSTSRPPARPPRGRPPPAS